MGIFMVLVHGQVENLVLLLQNKEAESIARHPTHREHHQQVPSVKCQMEKAYCVLAAIQKPPMPVKLLCHLQSKGD